MAKSYFTPKELHDQFEPLVGNFDYYTQAELADEISLMFNCVAPSADGYPTCFPGQPDWDEIAGQIKVYVASRKMSKDEAMQIVTDLARQNVIDDIEEEKFKQLAALDVVDTDAPGDDWTYESLQPLGEEWLALQMEADLTEEWETNAACDKRMTEIETALPSLYLAGLSLGLEWVLKRQLQEAIDDHDLA